MQSNCYNAIQYKHCFQHTIQHPFCGPPSTSTTELSQPLLYTSMYSLVTTLISFNSIITTTHLNCHHHYLSHKPPGALLPSPFTSNFPFLKYHHQHNRHHHHRCYHSSASHIPPHSASNRTTIIAVTIFLHVQFHFTFPLISPASPLS